MRHGVEIFGSDTTGNVVIGNYIGTDVTGSMPVENWLYGVLLWGGTHSNQIGGVNPGEGNIIAYNSIVTDGSLAGVGVDSGYGNSILGNSIHDNLGPGIRLNSTNNANNNQAAPVLSAATSSPGGTAVTGTLHSTPDTTFTLEFFANAAPDPTGFGEGQTPIGTYTVTTDAGGDVSFTASLPTPAPAGQGYLSATATDPAGNTSEFSNLALVATPPSASLSGIAFVDFNDDGEVDFGESGIAGVTVTLTGTDDLSNPVSLTQTTDADGAYVFSGLRPGQYYLTETQPAGYPQGINSVGTAGGILSAADQFYVELAQGATGLNYNFGERPAAGGTVHTGQTAGIGFWNNRNGQNLIKSLNGGPGSTQLGNWLAATFENLYGAAAGSNNLGGKTNAQVAAFFQSQFAVSGQKLDAQVLATALAVYVTNQTLAGTTAVACGFQVTQYGLGAATYNVGSRGAAFDVANDTALTVMDLLLATNRKSSNGILYYDPNAGVMRTQRSLANALYSDLNQAGGIG